MIVDPYYPRLITRRAAEMLVKEHPEITDGSVEIDTANVEVISTDYAREILRLWPRAYISLRASVDTRINWMRAKDSLR